MTDATTPQKKMTYLNPVYDQRGFADPFVLKYCGEYWGYCTGHWSDGRCFGIMRSRNLVDWEEVGGALEPFPEGHTCYWAPEVTYYNGRFYMYYSVGNEENMVIRVAVAECPEGPFIDSDRALTDVQFAIDAHVFVDDDGQRYLFYATDFLEHTRIGTGTVADRLIDPFTLEGKPHPVSRACYDWQIYDPQRAEKGGVCWHTIEGSFVLKHKGHYYQMFSGGNWTNTSYGVSYTITDDVSTTDEWRQVADGESVFPVLRTIPGQVVGPGHNSVVRGPDNQQLYCVYHRWGKDDRVLAIDPLDWAGERMLVLGPSTEPQPLPLPPTFADYFEGEREGLCEGWVVAGGRWSTESHAAIQHTNEPLAEARCLTTALAFVAETSLRALGEAVPDASFGVSVDGKQGALLRFSLVPSAGEARVEWHSNTGWQTQRIALSSDFAFQSYHLLRIETDGALIRLALDDVMARWQGTLASNPGGIALLTQGMPAAFAGFQFTVGWQDLFDREGSLIESGWQIIGDSAGASCELREQQLWLSAVDNIIVAKGPLLDAYEGVVNARLESQLSDRGGYGFYLAARPDHPGQLFLIERNANGWQLYCDVAPDPQVFALPAAFDPFHYQQFRFRKQGAKLRIHWEAELLGEIDVDAQPSRIHLITRGATAAFDMVRVAALKG